MIDSDDHSFGLLFRMVRFSIRHDLAGMDEELIVEFSNCRNWLFAVDGPDLSDAS